MKRKSHHVTHNHDGGWDVKKGRGERSIKHFDRKSDAIDYGRQVSQNQKSELVIHGRDNRIQRSDSHGNDPCPPRDRK